MSVYSSAYVKGLSLTFRGLLCIFFSTYSVMCCTSNESRVGPCRQRITGSIMQLIAQKHAGNDLSEAVDSLTYVSPLLFDLHQLREHVFLFGSNTLCSWSSRMVWSQTLMKLDMLLSTLPSSPCLSSSWELGEPTLVPWSFWMVMGEVSVPHQERWP